jgi:hypothetical protein
MLTDKVGVLKIILIHPTVIHLLIGDICKLGPPTGLSINTHPGTSKKTIVYIIVYHSFEHSRLALMVRMLKVCLQSVI